MEHYSTSWPCHSTQVGTVSQYRIFVAQLVVIQTFIRECRGIVFLQNVGGQIQVCMVL
jgi:hypothetical protein